MAATRTTCGAVAERCGLRLLTLLGGKHCCGRVHRCLVARRYRLHHEGGQQAAGSLYLAKTTACLCKRVGVQRGLEESVPWGCMGHTYMQKSIIISSSKQHSIEVCAGRVVSTHGVNSRTSSSCRTASTAGLSCCTLRRGEAGGAGMLPPPRRKRSCAHIGARLDTSWSSGPAASSGTSSASLRLSTSHASASTSSAHVVWRGGARHGLCAAAWHTQEGCVT